MKLSIEAVRQDWAALSRRDRWCIVAIIFSLGGLQSVGFILVVVIARWAMQLLGLAQPVSEREFVETIILCLVCVSLIASTLTMALHTLLRPPDQEH